MPSVELLIEKTASCSRNGSTLRQGISQEVVVCDSMEHFNFWHMQGGGMMRIWLLSHCLRETRVEEKYKNSFVKLDRIEHRSDCCLLLRT